MELFGSRMTANLYIPHISKHMMLISPPFKIRHTRQTYVRFADEGKIRIKSGCQGTMVLTLNLKPVNSFNGKSNSGG